MLSPQYLLPLADELVVDLFAGGGGASCGIELANYAERLPLKRAA